MRQKDGSAGPGASLGGALREVTSNLERLVGDHLALARLELSRDLHSFSREATLVGVGLSLCLAAYLFAMACLTAFLWMALSLPLACLAVGALNAALGSATVAVALAKLRRRPRALPATALELRRDRLRLSQLGRDLFAEDPGKVHARAPGSPSVESDGAAKTSH